jgi:undecaprenyl-diphosphatase
MTFLQLATLAVIQGVCELLPVSSSAHVIVAEKLMGLDPSAPQMTLLLVMLHTGTMFAVIVYFWRSWRTRYFGSMPQFKDILIRVVAATALTGVIGLALKWLIERQLPAAAHGTAEIEQLFANTHLIAAALAAAGLLILVASRVDADADAGGAGAGASASGRFPVSTAAVIGAVQGLCLPFRGFSRSGATISTGLLLKMNKARAEEFSFALAVVLTPAVVLREGLRAFSSSPAGAGAGDWHSALVPSLVGMVLSFLAGIVSLRWLSRWLEAGRWHYFGWYCLLASVAVLTLG